MRQRQVGGTEGPCDGVALTIVQPVTMAFVVVTAFCIWAVWDTWRLLKGLDPVGSASRDTLDELRRQHGAFEIRMRIQQRVGWFIYLECDRWRDLLCDAARVLFPGWVHCPPPQHEKLRYA